MVLPDSRLVALILLIDRIPAPPAPPRRGRPVVYPDRLFLKALVIMIVRRLSRVGSLLAVLEQPTPEMRRLRALLCEGGRYPARRTFERRLKALPATLPAQIGCLGRHLVAELEPWARRGRAAALDSTVLAASGGVWHRKHRERGEVPHPAIDPEAHGTKSGWHGRVYGWKLHLAVSVAAVRIPLAADNVQAISLLPELPAEVRVVLGDVHYNDPTLRQACDAAGRSLVTTKRGPYPHADDGVEVRRVFHKLRSLAHENFNGQFKGLFGLTGRVPTKGLVATRRHVLGAVLVYQLLLLQRHRTDQSLADEDLRRGVKPLLQAASLHDRASVNCVRQLCEVRVARPISMI